MIQPLDNLKALYDELAAYTFTRRDAEFIHQHEVDARGASENLNSVKPIRLFFSLAGLYLFIDKGFSGRQIQAAHARMAASKKEWPSFSIPIILPKMTIADVVAKPPGKERDTAIIDWARAVWETWEAEHGKVRIATDRLLEGWIPPNK